jgi:transposase
MMKTLDPHLFRSGRDFAPWMGLTPTDHSTAGKARHGVIMRAGDELLRSTLVVGATAVVQHARKGRGRDLTPWLLGSIGRKSSAKLVAVANKLARIA